MPIWQRFGCYLRNTEERVLQACIQRSHARPTRLTSPSWCVAVPRTLPAASVAILVAVGRRQLGPALVTLGVAFGEPQDTLELGIHHTSYACSTSSWVPTGNAAYSSSMSTSTRSTVRLS